MQKASSRNQELKERWETLISLLTERFSETETIDIEGILYLIGIQELGQIHKRFKKDDNVNIIHIGICSVLEPFGYYEFDYFDDEGWPHFKLVEELPTLKPGEQSVLMKDAVVHYFIEKGLIQ
ncbi:MAG: hypothetical protein CMP52_02700 [Flavobacteriales bacterium]|jgi:hypothetical protein|nr:hypothetical protein [Candidatus Arcticimaribacter sp.]